MTRHWHCEQKGDRPLHGKRLKCDIIGILQILEVLYLYMYIRQKHTAETKSSSYSMFQETLRVCG